MQSGDICGVLIHRGVEANSRWPMIATSEEIWIVSHILQAARVRRDSVHPVLAAFPHQDAANGPLNVFVLERQPGWEKSESSEPYRVIVSVLVGVHGVGVVWIPVAQLRDTARDEHVVAPDRSLLYCESYVDVGLDVAAGFSGSDGECGFVTCATTHAVVRVVRAGIF